MYAFTLMFSLPRINHFIFSYKARRFHGRPFPNPTKWNTLK